MLTVGELKKILNKLPDNMEVRIQTDEDDEGVVDHEGITDVYFSPESNDPDEFMTSMMYEGDEEITPTDSSILVLEPESMITSDEEIEDEEEF